MTTRLRLFFHDHCFDGTASAALFSAFYRQRAHGEVEVLLQGLQHSATDPYAGYELEADDVACVDFRYDPALTWWFDHHVTAFQPPSLRATYDCNRQGGQLFFDPQARSCTAYMARVLRERFGWEAPGFSDVIHWADLIDGAVFDDARTIVELEAPALRIATWLEHITDPALTHRLIDAFGREPLAELAAAPWIAEPLAPVLAQHRANIGLIGDRAEHRGGVVSFDLAGDGIGAYNKFIPYMLFPEARYTVGVTLSESRAKVSVGFNPWAAAPREHDIAALCARFGGGGHPMVGAVSLTPDQLPRVREIAVLIGDELRA